MAVPSEKEYTAYLYALCLVCFFNNYQWYKLINPLTPKMWLLILPYNWHKIPVNKLWEFDVRSR